MGVRLNKVLSELNIGLQTAVDFLKKKNRLGEVKEDATPNTKISDEQYEALVSEFKGDKAIKKQAEMIFPKKKEKEKEKKKEEAPKVEVRQQFKPLGKIDLDNLNKRPAPTAAPKETPKPKAAAESPAKEVEESPKVKVESVKEPPVAEPVVKKEEAPQPAEVKPAEVKPAEAKPAGPKTDEVKPVAPKPAEGGEEEGARGEAGPAAQREEEACAHWQGAR